MISVEEAKGRIVDALRASPAETVALSLAAGRVLAEDVVSRRTQPPVDMSAMDGWAVRAADVTKVPALLTEVGAAPAGGAFDGVVGPGQAVRIFTGGPLPRGADCIVIQEDADRSGMNVTVREASKPGQHVRRAGLDFSAGDVKLKAGRRLTPADIGLAAAMDVPWLAVRRRPRVALLATGDELVRPGEPVGPNQIVSSNALALSALIAGAGGEAIDLGIARDNRESLIAALDRARGADLLVTLGGASVGEYDLVQKAFGERGLALDFWRIAMRPGKPLMFGNVAGTPVLGLPGNPVSSLVCGMLFLIPALEKMLGLNASERPRTNAKLGRDLAANDQRQDYLRSTLTYGPDGAAVATPFEIQDSSNLSRLAAADCLVIRAPRAPAARRGDLVEIILLASFGL
ncbi:MAG TPA: gephyrin-like molybdotransferase Glp [Candidatus Cybelea sp.]|nr:gephyrin-like molybdotransferase Glp [Candidatus Cybelea sp.]